MRDAIAALEAACSELRDAEAALPDDMAEQVKAVITKAETLLEALRAKLPG